MRRLVSCRVSPFMRMTYRNGKTRVPLFYA